jgi:hypothetical protein
MTMLLLMMILVLKGRHLMMLLGSQPRTGQGRYVDIKIYRRREAIVGARLESDVLRGRN